MHFLGTGLIWQFDDLVTYLPAGRFENGNAEGDGLKFIPAPSSGASVPHCFLK
jgi:hypothetical protein